MNVKLKFTKLDVLFQLNNGEFSQNQLKGFLVGYVALLIFVFPIFVNFLFLLIVEPVYFLICFARDKGIKSPIANFLARYAYTGVANGLGMVLPGLIVLSIFWGFGNQATHGVFSVTLKKSLLVLWYLVAQFRRIMMHADVIRNQASTVATNVFGKKTDAFLGKFDKLAASISEEIKMESSSDRSRLADRVADLAMNGDLSRCPECGYDTSPNMTFCVSCGARIRSAESKSPPCAKCGAELVPGGKFCPQCHHPVGLAPKPKKKPPPKGREPVPLTDRAAVEQAVAALENASLEKDASASKSGRKLTEGRERVISTLASLVPGAVNHESDWDKAETTSKPEIMKSPEKLAKPETPQAEPLEPPPIKLQKPSSARPPERVENKPSPPTAYHSPDMAKTVKTEAPAYAIHEQSKPEFMEKQAGLTKPVLTSAPGFSSTKPTGTSPSTKMEKPALSPSVTEVSSKAGGAVFGGDKRNELVCIECRHLNAESSICKKGVMPVSDTYCWHQNKI